MASCGALPLRSPANSLFILLSMKNLYPEGKMAGDGQLGTAWLRQPSPLPARQPENFLAKPKIRIRRMNGRDGQI
jgi:hypothetical protein